MNTTLISKSIIGAFLLTLIGALIGYKTALSHDMMYYAWVILANGLLTLVLGYYITHAVPRGIKLTAFVFIFLYIIGTFNILIEALIFNVTDNAETIHQMITGFFIALIYSPLLVRLFDKWDGESTTLSFTPRSFFNWTWRVTTVFPIYLFLYLTAGFILVSVYPELLEFYSDKIPPFSTMIGTQIPRSLMFAGCALIILRTTDITLGKRALLLGTMFVLVGGIVQLITPNEFMPLNVRIGHGFEVGISNFILGVVTSYLLGQKIRKNQSHP